MRTIAAVLLVAPLALAATACEMGLDPQTQQMIKMAERMQAGMKDGSYMAGFAPHVEGQIAVASPPGVAAPVVFDQCQSGEPDGFFGVDLVSSGTPAALRVTRDAIDGTRARFTRAGKPSVALDASACSVLQADLVKTGTKINTITLLDGNVTLDCVAPDGTTLAGQVSFSKCQRSPAAASVVAALSGAASGGPADTEMASAMALPDHSERPELPARVRALSVRPSARVVGSTVGGEAQSVAEHACLENARAFCREMGWTVREDAAADLDVEIACSGHVTFRENASAIEIVLPPTNQPSIVLRAKGAVLDTIPTGPRGLRCDIPGGASPARTRACVARAESYASARLAGLLAASAPLNALAAGRR